MDLLLKDGDYLPDHQNRPRRVEGGQELAQRALIRLAARRGSVPGDPSLGSRLHRLGGACGPERLEREALAAVREALSPMRELRVLGVSCRYGPRGGLEVRVRAASGDTPCNLEVCI